MSEIVKKVNAFFKTAVRTEVENLKAEILLSERQSKVFDMYYIKKQDVGFIADALGSCEPVIKTELKIIREKIEKTI